METDEAADGEAGDIGRVELCLETDDDGVVVVFRLRLDTDDAVEGDDGAAAVD